MTPRIWLWVKIGLILIIIVLGVLVDIPQGPNFFGREIKIHQGLDLQGGAHLVFGADLSGIEEADKNNAMNSAVSVVRRRVDALGVAEPSIQRTEIEGKKAIIVELPGVKNIDEAIKMIGKTAQLKFLEMPDDPEKAKKTEGAISGFVPTKLTGAYLRSAKAEFQGGSGRQGAVSEPIVSLKFNQEGAKIFKDLTKKNLQKPLAIALDNEIISAPTVQSVIENGDAMITGNFTIEEAKKLALQLNAGALPVPINLIEERSVGATLGSESIRNSIMAGLIGIILVMIFMILFYRYLGLLASVSLIIYSIIIIALFKLIPVTLTLAGIAGFILSLGMAIDANVLIFERAKEELREREDVTAAIEEGFRRAWPSIRDSNLSTIITCLILFYFGTGIVRGFALTLGIGVLVSMFTAITVTKSFLYLTVMGKFGKNLVKKV